MSFLFPGRLGRPEWVIRSEADSVGAEECLFPSDKPDFALLFPCKLRVRDIHEIGEFAENISPKENECRDRFRSPVSVCIGGLEFTAVESFDRQVTDLVEKISSTMLFVSWSGKVLRCPFDGEFGFNRTGNCLLSGDNRLILKSDERDWRLLRRPESASFTSFFGKIVAAEAKVMSLATF